MATLHDVASKAEVSARTVSRVVNGEGGYSEATRQRVLECVDDLRYRPNLLARGLISGRSSTIALLGNEMTDPFIMELAAGIESAARRTGRTMFFASTGKDADRQAEALKTLWSYAVEGVITLPVHDSESQSESRLAGFGRRGLPIVVVGDIVEAPNVACVRFDLEACSHLAAQHLLDAGRRRLGMIGSTTLLSRQHLRESGFLAEVARTPGVEGRAVRVDQTVAGAKAGLSQLLEQQPDLDGVLAYNDLMAIGAMHAARAQGRRVPDDIAVVGIGDVSMSALVTPALTTVRFDLSLLAGAVMAALDGLIQAPGSQPDPVVLPVGLVVRESA